MATQIVSQSEVVSKVSGDVVLTVEQQATMYCLLWEMRDRLKTLREMTKWKVNGSVIREQNLLRRAHLSLYSFGLSDEALEVGLAMFETGEYKKVYQ